MMSIETCEDCLEILVGLQEGPKFNLVWLSTAPGQDTNWKHVNFRLVKISPLKLAS